MAVRVSMLGVLAQLLCCVALIVTVFSFSDSSNRSSKLVESLFVLQPESRLGDMKTTKLYERQLDEGEDYFSAIQAPDKPYEW